MSLVPNLIPLPIPHDWDLTHLERCDSSVRLRRLVEIAIVRMLVTHLIAAGFMITVSYGEDPDEDPVKQGTDVAEIVDAAFAVDDCCIFVHKPNKKRPFAWINLIYGNDGWDVISDYTTNIEDHLKNVNDYADGLSAWF